MWNLSYSINTQLARPSPPPVLSQDRSPWSPAIPRLPKPPTSELTVSILFDVAVRKKHSEFSWSDFYGNSLNTGVCGLKESNPQVPGSKGTHLTLEGPKGRDQPALESSCNLFIVEQEAKPGEHMSWPRNRTIDRLSTESAMVCQGFAHSKEAIWNPFYFKLVISKLHSNKKVKV